MYWIRRFVFECGGVKYSYDKFNWYLVNNVDNGYSIAAETERGKLFKRKLYQLLEKVNE